MADFKRPAWLGPEPLNSFEQYGGVGQRQRASDAWQMVPGKTQCLHDTHDAALGGDPFSLEQMRQFYINLTTERLKS